MMKRRHSRLARLAAFLRACAAFSAAHWMYQSADVSKGSSGGTGPISAHSTTGRMLRSMTPLAFHVATSHTSAAVLPSYKIPSTILCIGQLLFGRSRVRKLAGFAGPFSWLSHEHPH